MTRTAEEVAEEILGIVRNPDTINEFQMAIAVDRLTAFADSQIFEQQRNRVNNHADAKRLIEWIDKDDRPALTAFTDGPDRQVGYAVERFAEERVKEAEENLLRASEKMALLAMEKARAEALEEAAKVAERSADEWGLVADDRLSEKIRALKDKP